MPILSNIPSWKKTENKLTNHAKNALARSFLIARYQNSSQTKNIHLFQAVFLESGSMGSVILKDMGITQKQFPKLKESMVPNIDDKKMDSPIPSPRFKKTFIKAFSIAKKLNYSYVGTEHLVWALLDSSDNHIVKIVGGVKKKMNKKTDANSTFSLFEEKTLLTNLSAFLSGFPELGLSPDILPGMDPEKRLKMPKNNLPYISKFCINLNEQVKKRGDVVIGRRRETERMINILGRKNKNNPLLIGHPGVGKTAIVMKMAELINSNSVPPFLFGRKIMSLDVAALVAGTSFRGEFEIRLKELIKEVSSNDDIILFIDEIHNIVGAGNMAGSMDLANIIKPALAQGDIRLIGATTYKEYKQYIEKDAALERRFQSVQIAEPTQEETKKIMLGLKENYESFHDISISDEAIDLAVELGARYISDRYLPDKAIDVLDEAAAHLRSTQKISELAIKTSELRDEKVRLSDKKEETIDKEKYEEALALREKETQLQEKINFLNSKKMDNKTPPRLELAAKDIIETVSRISGIPHEKLSRSNTKKIRNATKLLKTRIIGQDEVVKKLGSALARSQFGLNSPERPFGSFLFLGPTGVGKTLTAKVLAEEIFENPKNLVRIDMSEFMERHNVAGLIGSPAGYVGYGEGGRLTEKIRRQPYSVVLFDEIEKAHPDVHNILLQILDEGTLTDAQGLEVSFKNTIIILTTNIGTENFNELAENPALGFHSEGKVKMKNMTSEQVKELAIKELEDRTRPELLNRLDHILVFDLLTQRDMEKISALEISKLKERMKKMNLGLMIGPEVKKFIAQKSLAPNQGARLVRKNIQDMIENRIADMIIRDKVRRNTITVSVKKGELKLI